MKVIIFPVNVVLLFFFFPSRRRHTSWPRDWSSDVCSSDLAARSRSKPQSTSTVLVDCGFDRERAAAKGRFQQTHPLELLARMGVSPQEVDHVIISHMHYDHVGNVQLFPKATFSMAREEYDFCSGPYGNRELMRALVDPEEVRIVQDLARQERLHLIDDSEQLFPGVVVTRLGGHT